MSELPPVRISKKDIPNRFPGWEGFSVLHGIASDAKIAHEVFGFVTAKGHFVQTSVGSGDKNEPSVARDWPSEEFSRWGGKPPPCAAHTHPFNEQRSFDPPTVEDVCIFLNFSLCSRMFGWPAERETHFVVSQKAVFAIYRKDERALEEFASKCANRDLKTCEKDLFSSLRSRVRESVRAPLMRAFGPEGYRDIDSIASSLGASIMQRLPRMLRYLEILEENTPVKISYQRVEP